MSISNEENSRYIAWLISVIIAYSLAILQIYAVYRLHSIKHLIIVQKRYPKIVFFEAIMMIIYLFISLPFVNKNIVKIKYFEPYTSIFAFSTYPYLSHATVNAEVSRLWLIYFDLCYLRSVKNESWKSIINIKLKNKDWFLNNKHKYGNKQWIILRVFIYYFLSATLLCILWNIFGAVHWINFVDGSLYGLPIMISLCIYYKCPKHTKDYFLFQYEFKATSIIMIIIMIIYLISTIFYYIWLYLSDIMIVSMSFVPSFVSLLSTLWIPHKILTKTVWNDKMNNKQDIVMNVIHVNGDSNNHGASIKDKLLTTLKNKYDLELFIDHISHEFSLEVFLSFVEFVQFKQYFWSKYHENHTENSQINRSQSYILDDSIPKSSIVYGEKNMNIENKEQLILHIKNSAYLLYKKYISVGCELEINISASLRARYYNMMDNKLLWINNMKIEMNELIIMFDDIIDEMYFLMTQSFVRFTYI